MAPPRLHARRIPSKLDRQGNGSDILGPINRALKIIAELVPPDKEKDASWTKTESCNAVSNTIDVDKGSADGDSIRRRDEHISRQCLASDIKLLIKRVPKLASI